VGHKKSAHENCADKPVNQKGRLSSSPSRATVPITQNSTSKAPLSLSEQGTDPLQVSPMNMELHEQREEVGKAFVTEMSLHTKRISALSCLQGRLRSLLFPQPSPLLYCLTNTRLKKHHTGHQYGMTCVSHLAPELCKRPLVTLRSVYQH